VTVKPRNVLIIALLVAAAAAAFPLMRAWRLGEASGTATIVTAAVGGGLMAVCIAVAARQNPPLMLRPASRARRVAAGALALFVVLAYAALAFGARFR